MRIALLSVFAALAPFAFADVSVTSPAAGATLKAGTSITIEWEDSGDSPKLDSLSTYQIFLCAGGNTDGQFIQLASITTTGTFSSGNSATGTISAGVGASTPANAYFLKFISAATDGGTVTNYSPRFSVSGMTGTFPASISTGLSSISGTDGPATVNAVSNSADTNGDAAADEYDVPYASQTGLTRYAPMQSLPPTSITKKSKTPLYPTTAATIATTYLPVATQWVTTMTQSQTWTISQMENTAEAVANPTDDMQKFLNRWKD